MSVRIQVCDDGAVRRLVIIASWIVLGALSSGIAWAVLSTADREVGAGPASPVLTVALSSTTTTPESTTSSSTGSSTSTTSASSPPSSGQSSDDWEQSTVPSAGGTVVVEHRPGEVRLVSATPRPGFAMEIDDRGGDEVRVEFESDDDSFEVRVRWDDGALRIDVD